MITVKLVRYENEKGNRIGLCVRGHANYAKRGDDIVCAAVSAIAQHTIGGCKTYSENTEVKYLREGYILFDTEFNERSMALVYSAYHSFKNLAEQYPQCFNPVQ